MKITLLTLALASIFAGQWVYFHQAQQIKQRYVQVYVMAPEGNSVIWEARNDE